MTQEDNFIIFSDIKHLFFKRKWVILLGALLFGAIGFLARTQTPAYHKVVAVFKEENEKGARFTNGSFDALLGSLGLNGKAQQGQFLLLSSAIMEPVIERLGLQIEVSAEGEMARKKRRFCAALKRERGLPTEATAGFTFADVQYVGETPKHYSIFFTSKDTFEVRDAKHHVLAQGVRGQETTFDGVTATLTQTPETLSIRRPYPLSVSPLSEKVLELKQTLDITQLGGDPSLLEITLLHPSRQLAITLLNTLMEEYQGHLHRENQKLSDQQLAYLEKRRDDFCTKMQAHLKTHAAYLKENLETQGTLHLKEQLPLFQERKETFANRLMEVNLKLEKLADVDPLLAVDLGREVETLQEEVHQISKERDGLTLASLGEGALTKQDNVLLEPHTLKKIQEDKTHLLTKLEEHPQDTLAHAHLKDRLRLLSLREGTLKRELFYKEGEEKHYEGIDLKTARALLVTYLQERDAITSKIEKMNRACKESEGENVEWISLAPLFPDPLCQTMVQEIGALKQQLRQRRVFTEKEETRVKKKIERLKEDLDRHIEQTLTLLTFERQESGERIDALRLAIIHLLGQEVSLIEKQIGDRIEEKCAYLEKEKTLLGNKLSETLKEMERVPDAWLREYELEFNADMNKAMLSALVQLVESKSIERQLSALESKPIDYASASIFPKRPLLKVFGGVGVFLGALVTFAVCLIHAFCQGIPLTLQNMAVRGKNILGPLSKKGTLKDNLEPLRRFSLTLQEKNQWPLTAALILGNGKDYSPLLAELLSKEGKKVLVIDLDFTKKAKEQNLPGLIHFLEGELKKPTIVAKHYGDYIPMGGKTPFGDEILKKAAFETFLKETKQKYDVVLLAVRATGDSALAKTFFKNADMMVLNLEGLSYHALTPYFDWEGEGHSLAFT